MEQRLPPTYKTDERRRRSVGEEGGPLHHARAFRHVALDTLPALLEHFGARIGAIAAELEQLAVAASRLVEADLEHATALRRELDLASRRALQTRDVLVEAARRCDSAWAGHVGADGTGRKRSTT